MPGLSPAVLAGKTDAKAVPQVAVGPAEKRRPERWKKKCLQRALFCTGQGTWWVKLGFESRSEQREGLGPVTSGQGEGQAEEPPVQRPWGTCGLVTISQEESGAGVGRQES